MAFRFEPGVPLQVFLRPAGQSAGLSFFLFPRIVCNASPSPINRTDEARAKNRRAEIADPRCAPTGK